MNDTIEVSLRLCKLGLSEQKVKETLTNETLTNNLLFIIHKACEYEEELNRPIDKNIGNLLYNLGTKLPKQLFEYIPLLIKYIIEEKIKQEVQLSAAMRFLQENYSKELDMKTFETECGVGISVSVDEIENAVADIISQNHKQIMEQRYQYNVGPLMAQVRQSLKWAENRKIKEEFDLQILTILGPKTEEDIINPSKKEKQNLSSKKEIANKAIDKQPITMMEFLKTVQFHKPGENFKANGYIITDHTHEHLKEHLQITNGKVRTRFPPEPNGILHIGHAKAININFGYAAAHDGLCFLRYDDTNPEKEEEKFFKGIKDMVEWLGYKPYKITHSSDYFGQLYELAVKLIGKGLAYVCHQKPEEVRGRDPPPSPWRDRDSEESLKLFQQMRMGFFDEGEATLRLKVTLEEGKVDPVAYRIKYLAHHRTKNQWCIYPTYDYTHCVCDSIEHITHSLCTKEFQSRRSSYYWLCNALDIYCPVQWEYGRLNMLYAVVSKRKIAKLITEGYVRDWDDPRLFTLTALRRRGFPPEAINNFCAALGLTGAQISIHPDALEAYIRDSLNLNAKRVMAILEPLRLEVVNFPSESAIDVAVPNIPGNDNAGTHTVPFGREVWIEASDFKEFAEKGYRRLTLSQSVGLKHCGFIIKVINVKNDSNGRISHLEVTCEPVSNENKPKAFIHWVSSPILCEVRLYEQLFLHENPEDPVAVPGGFLSNINPNSLTVLDSLVDISVEGAQVLDKFQFERVGFFCVDSESSPSKLIFNRTVSLKEDRGKV